MHLRRHLTRTIGLYFFVLVAILVVDILILVQTNALSETKYLAYYYVGYVFSSMRYLQIIYFTWMIRKRLVFLNSTLTKLLDKKNGGVQTLSLGGKINSIRFLDMDLNRKWKATGNKVAPKFDQVLTGILKDDLTSLEVLRDVYNKLWVNSQLFNKAFGLSLLLNIGYDFMALTTDIYWIIVSYSTVVANTNPTPALYCELSQFSL